MADVTVTIDGTTITVPAGTNIVDAARSAHVSIPVFCYHPRMKPVGMCRMCLVATGGPKIDPATRQPVLDGHGKPVIAMNPKLVAGCTTPVTDGMVVVTASEQVKFAQKGVIEFLLTSHPLDCPICDKGGECPLQDLTMGWGPTTSRFDYGDKSHFDKPVPLGDLIYLDRERCILCGRCVRYQDELADDPVLGFDSRGHHWHIISKSDPPFNSKFSGNTTDICPVGALTTAEFRFRARAWELSPKPSICTHCPVGCNIMLDMRHNALMRVMPRENAAVNDIWLCNKGRFGQRFFGSKDRLTTPLVRRGKNLEPATWDEAISVVAEKFAAIHSKQGGAALAGLAGDRLANEDFYLFQKLFRETLGSPHLDHSIGAPGEPADDDIGVELGVGVGTNLHELGIGTAVLVLGADPEEEAPLYMLRLRSIAERGGKLVVANVRPTKLDRSATQHLRYSPGSEVQLVRALQKAVFDQVGTQRAALRFTGIEELRTELRALDLAKAAEACGVSVAALQSVAKTLIDANNGIIVYGADALAAGAPLTHALGSLAVLAGKVGRANSGLIALLPGGNTRGALDMGVRADRGPGYATLPQRGLAARELWGALTEGKVRGLYVAGLDPVSEHLASRAALERLDFLVVQDLFLTATAQIADVVLPAAAFAERDGTYTNAERRVQRARQATAAPGLAWPDWQIVSRVGQALSAAALIPVITAAPVKAARTVAKGGTARSNEAVAAPATTAAATWDYLSVSEVANEIAARVPSYAGITYTALTATGRNGTWGRQVHEDHAYEGTRYENIEGVGIVYPAPCEQPRTSFSLAPLAAKGAKGSEAYGLLLLTQRLLYDADPLLRESRLLRQVPEAFVAIGRKEAAKHGIVAGQRVRIESAAGALELPVRVVVDLPEGCLLIPQRLPNASLATLQTGPRTFVKICK